MSTLKGFLLEVPGPWRVCHWTGGGWTIPAAIEQLGRWTAGPIPVHAPGTRPELLKLEGPRKNPGPILRGRL